MSEKQVSTPTPHRPTILDVTRNVDIAGGRRTRPAARCRRVPVWQRSCAEPIGPVALEADAAQHTALLAPVAGAVVGVGVTSVAVNSRSRRDMSILRMQIDAQLTLATRQYELHLESLRQAHHRAKVDEAYYRLAVWLDMAEPTIDEIWFGSFSDNEAMRQRAKKIVERWPWDRRIPPEISPARVDWSNAVREQIRNCNYEMTQLVIKATAAMAPMGPRFYDDDNGAEYAERSRMAVLEHRGIVLRALDKIRDKVRVDLG